MTHFEKEEDEKEDGHQLDYPVEKNNNKQDRESLIDRRKGLKEMFLREEISSSEYEKLKEEVEKELIKLEKEEDEKEHKPNIHKHNKTNTHHSKINVWQISTGILIVLFLISIFIGGLNFSSNLSKDKIGEKVASFVNEQLLAGQGTATISSVSEEGNLYNIKLNVNGQVVDSYVTKDGKIFFPQAIKMDEYAAPASSSPTAANLVDTADIIDDDAIKGDENAPVTIVEFSDYECPFCERFYSQTFGQIDDKYIKTGKVKFVYRDFPLSFHANAQKAAEAAEVAGKLGGDKKYYEMHNLLFERGVTGGISLFKQYARDIGLNGTEFDQLLDSGAMASEVKKDFSDGQKLGVSGTPAFFINGIEVIGAQPFSVFEQVIEGELAK